MRCGRAGAGASAFVAAFVAACGAGDVGAPPAGTDPDALEPMALRSVPAEPAEGLLGPGGRPFRVTRRTPGTGAHLYARTGRADFSLSARLGEPTLVQYPCSSCHEGVVLMEERIPDAHRNIQPVHPSTTAATCATCHSPGAVERLTLAEGGTVSMDHAYRLCARCHASEVRDWAGGAHGKRLEGWVGERVVMNCADCHDPHRPAVAPRIPYPGPPPPTRGGGR